MTKSDVKSSSFIVILCLTLYVFIDIFNINDSFTVGVRIFVSLLAFVLLIQIVREEHKENTQQTEEKEEIQP
jgi:Ca2+/Na+ antiporter